MFPREIFDLIIDNLHDDIQTLLQLSLVSITISDSSRRHLLRSVTINLEKLEVFLTECDTGSGSGRDSSTNVELTESQGGGAIATFKDYTRNFQLVCTAGVGKNGCWCSCLRAVGRIPLVLPNMKSLALVNFPFYRLYAPPPPGAPTQLTNLSSLQTALGLTMKAFHKIETLVVKSTDGFINYEPLHLFLVFFFPNVRKLVCQEPDEQCSLLVPCGTPPTLPNDMIPLSQLRSLELVYPSKDIYTMLLHGPHYLKNIQSLVLEEGPCFSGSFKSYDILKEVGMKLRCLRLNLDAVARNIVSQPQLWDLSHNPNLNTLILHTRHNPRRRYFPCSTGASWIIDVLNVIDPPRLRNLVLLVEEERHGQILQRGHIDVSSLELLYNLGQCESNSFLERLDEFWIMYKPVGESCTVIEGIPDLTVEEYMLGLFCWDAMTMEKRIVRPRVKVVKSVDDILDGFDLDPHGS